MPTKAEMQELEDNCTWEWTIQGGNNGYRVTGTNGNSIFMPAAGFYYNGSLELTDSLGAYWSSSLSLGTYPYDACNLNFYSNDMGIHNDGRVFGQSVRPVCHSQK